MLAGRQAYWKLSAGKEILLSLWNHHLLLHMC